jgi:hypothetical protein
MPQRTEDEKPVWEKVGGKEVKGKVMKGKQCLLNDVTIFM